MYRSKVYSRKRSKKAFWLVVLSLTLVLMVSMTGIAQAAGPVSGTVFRDYNANGTQDANEPGVGGITVTAFGAAGAVVGTSVSDSTVAQLGQFTVNVTSNDLRVRLEFTGLTGTSQQGAFAAAGSGTSVQFVDVPSTGVNYGINRPSDFCSTNGNPTLVTTCFELGAQNNGVRVVLSHNYTGGGLATVAQDTDVGTTWGVAYKRAVGTTPGTIYVSAFAKRQAEYGTFGSGAIYAITGGVASHLVDIPGAGATPHNAANYAIDSTFGAVPGKEGLGDMDISEDGTTLFVVNLADRNLYSVNLTTLAVAARGIIGPAGCTQGIYRPFGLGVRDGLVYVGGVCDGSGAADGDNTVLQAYVYSFNPTTNVSTQVLTFPLNYPRGCADVDPGYGNGSPGTPPITCRPGTSGSQAEWMPWRDTWPNPDQTPPGSGFAVVAGDGDFFAYPQPILAGIEFVDDDMIVSFRDRTGDQIGYRDNGPDGIGGAYPDQLITVTAGDILRAAPNGATWTIENNGAGADFSPSANGVGNSQGPGGGEFYSGDNFADGGGDHHDETITGGITVVPGTGEVTAEVMDPNALYSSGTAWFSNATGDRTRSFTIDGDTRLAPFNFGKGNGLGDLVALCDSAPIEIGNYVWFDANNNGIQDSGEQPLAGITVELTDAAGNPITVGGVPVTATTDAQGRYIFSSNTGTPFAANNPFVYSVPLLENTAYQVRIATTQPGLAAYNPTTPNVNGAPSTPGDVRDSDGNPATAPGFVVAPVTTGTSGQNDHTLDFGFTAPAYSLGNRVWFDDGRGGGTANDGLQNGTEPGIDGVTVNLVNNLGVVIDTTTTAAGGYYRFDNLPPGTYQVQIPASNFAPGGPLNGFNSSADVPNTPTPDSDTDRDDNGIGTGNGTITTGNITLGPPGPAEPTGTTDLGPGDNTPVLRRGRTNLTFVFVFVGPPAYSLGNRVWLDSNNNGVIDTNEMGLNGVTLNLYTVTGGVTSATPLRTTTTVGGGTNGNGYYLFDNLPAGDYVVEVAPASCAPGGPLAGLANSTGAGQETDPNLDGDSNDNGLDSSGTCSVRSGIVTLGPVGAEPGGETDLGPQGSGIATDTNSNLTVDFGYFGTPTNPQNPGTGNPQPITVDPAITKQVDPAFAQPGDEVRWTITLSNPHNVALNNVSFVDNVPSQLEILQATVDTTGGSLVVSGNTVTYSIVVLNPGQTLHVHILTRVRAGTPVPFIISNDANLTNGYTGSASATVLSVGSLPATGFPPPWRDPLIIGMSVLVVLFGVGAVRSRQRG